MTDLRLDPVIPIYLIVILCVLAGAVIWFSLRRVSQSRSRRLLLFAIRMTGIGLLAGLLTLPELLRVRKDEVAPTIAVLIDSSSSMLDSPNDDREERQFVVDKFLRSRAFRSATKKFNTKWYQFGDELEETLDTEDRAIAYNAPRSHLVKAVNDVVKRNRGINLAAIVVLSDGLDQSIQPLLSESLRVPLFIPELEHKEAKRTSRNVPDFAITDLNHPSMLVVNWKAEVDLLVKRDTAEKRLACPVKLLRGNTVVRSTTLVFAKGETTLPLTFAIEPPTVGRITYTIEINPEQDRRKDNNRRVFAIDVTDSKNRVLYLEGAPRWEFKYLKRSLMREKSYQVNAYVQSTPGLFINFSEGADSAEVTDMPKFSDASTLRFRAVILGELKASSLTEEQQQALVKYVERGGGLLFLGGPQAFGKDGWASSEIAKHLLPFSNEEKAKMADGRFSLSVSAEGRNHPILKGLDPELGMPDLLSLWRPVKRSASASTILEAADGSPVVLASRFGKGKIVAIMTDSLWRWQLGTNREEQGKSLYEQFIGQILYWLSPQKKEVDESSNLEIVTASPQAEVRQRVAVGAFAAEGSAKRQLRCSITMPDGRTVDYNMSPSKLGSNVGLTKAVSGWLAEFTPHMPGDYGIVVREAASGEKASSKVIVIEPQLERTGKVINREYLRKLASRTGGRFYKIAKHDDLPFDLPYHPEEVKRTSQRPIWNRWPVLFLLIALFTVEWIIRSKYDMV